MQKKHLMTVAVALCLCGQQSQASVEVMETDLLCAYSPDAASRSGGEANIQVNLANTVAGANTIQDNSGTGVRWHIAGFCMSTNNPVSQDNATVLGLLNSDAAYQDVRDYGAAIGADEVNYHAYTTGAAGNAYQPGMYTVMGVQWMWYIVFAHEVGHNFGANHADGLGFNGTNGSPYRTVMLHNYCGGTSLPYYTNPNLYYLGVELQGTAAASCGTGSPSYNGNNTKQIGSYGLTMSGNRARAVTPPDLTNVIYRWQFTNAAGSAFAGTTITDSVSGAVAMVRGTNATFTGNALRLPGGTTGNTAANSIAAYLDLPNGIISAQTNLTIEIWAAPLSSQNWQRLCSFGRTIQSGDGAPGEWTGTPDTAAPGTTQAYDELALSFNQGTSLNAQRFISQAYGIQTNNLDTTLPTLTNAQQHYTIVFQDGAGVYTNNGGRLTWYRNGDPVTSVDVNYHLSALHDVNNWLGRSLWSADSMANADYTEVRISHVALTRQQVQANFRLGANYPATNVTLTAHDALGSSSFNAAGGWSSGAAPTLSQDYDTSFFKLRTPATSSSYVFQGRSLTVSDGGALLWKGTASSTITVTNLIFNGGMVQHAGSGTFTLAGAVNVSSNGGTFYGVNGGITVSAGLAGNGPVTYLGGNATTLASNNLAFTGKHLIGAGGAGTLAIDSEARLGPMPASLVPDFITLNNGTLQTTTTFAFTNSNRGITLSWNGGAFSPNSGTTLTLSNNVTGIGNLVKAGQGTLILTGSNSFTGPLDVDTGSTTANDGILRISSPLAVPAAVPCVQIFNNNSGSSTLQLDGSGGNLTLARPFYVLCRANTVATIENLSGTNTIGGTVWLNVGGNLFNIQSDAGLLVFSGTNQYVGSLTGGRTYAFLGTGDHLVSGPILNSTNGAPISLTKSGIGRLTLAAANTYGGTTTVSGGTLLVNGSISTGAVTVASSATLGGIGTIKGPVTIQSGGTLSPASFIGVLTISNTLSLSGTTFMELNKTAGTNDLVCGLTSVTFGGNLLVTNLAGTLVAGDSFKLFNAGIYTGSFTGILPATPGPGLVWYTNTLATDGTLRIAAATNPVVSDFVLSGNSFRLNVTSGPAGSPYRVLTATNLLLPLTNWTPIWTNTFDTNGSGQFTNPAGPTNVQQFFNIAVP